MTMFSTNATIEKPRIVGAIVRRRSVVKSGVPGGAENMYPNISARMIVKNIMTDMISNNGNVIQPVDICGSFSSLVRRSRLRFSRAMLKAEHS